MKISQRLVFWSCYVMGLVLLFLAYLWAKDSPTSLRDVTVAFITHLGLGVLIAAADSVGLVKWAGTDRDWSDTLFAGAAGALLWETPIVMVLIIAMVGSVMATYFVVKGIGLYLIRPCIEAFAKIMGTVTRRR